MSFVPPAVVDPAAHTSQDAAPTLANRLSAPHLVHVALPAALNVPTMQGVDALVPEHVLPARHREHAARVVVVPPLVCDPDGHATHCAAEVPLYSLSLPHSVHDEPPRTALYFPAGQALSPLDPEHATPTGQSVQDRRVVEV